MTAEHQRLAVNATNKIPIEQWGPYLSERQWGTVREDYRLDSLRFYQDILFCIIELLLYCTNE